MIDEKKETLLKRQRQVIDDLQDKIRLLEFDKSQNLKDIAYLKCRLDNRIETIKRVKKDLIRIRREKDYESINNILLLLRTYTDDDE